MLTGEKPRLIRKNNSPVTQQDKDYDKQFECVLKENQFRYNLLKPQGLNDGTDTPNSTSTRSSIDSLVDTTNGRRTGRRPRSVSMPTPKTKLETLNVDFFTNENFTKKLYRATFWESEFKAKEHNVYLGYDDDLGPICASVVSIDGYHIVYILTNLKFAAVKVDDALIAPTSIKDTKLVSPKAYSIILYLAMEKYLFEIEEDCFQLLNWQQKINFSTPYSSDHLEKFLMDRNAYEEELKNHVNLKITSLQFIKGDLSRFINQFEQVHDPTIRNPLLNLERNMMQKSIHSDIIIHHSGLNRTMEQRDTYNAFLRMCGEQIVQDGARITHEEMINPTILTEELAAGAEGQERRETIFEELLDSETKYINKLLAIVNVYITPFRELALNKKKSIVIPYDIKALFNNIEEVLQVNQNFLAELKTYDPTKHNLGEICNRHMSLFSVYSTYITGYKYSLEYNCTLERKNAMFFNYIMSARDHPECDKLALKDLLVMPVQRIPRYNLLFSDYLRFTPKDHHEYNGLYSALVKVNEISYLSGHQLSEKALELSNMLRTIADCPPKIMSSSRHLVTQMDCVECDISTSVMQENITLYLLSDYLIVTKRNKESGSSKKKHYTFISWINLNGLEFLDAQHHGNYNGIYIKANLDYSEDLYWDHQEIHLYVTLNPSDKSRFYNELCTTAAICRAKATGSSCFYQTVNDLNMYFFIFKPEAYHQSKHKSDIALHYIEDLSIPIDHYFLNPVTALVSGMIRGRDCRFSLNLKSKVPCQPLDDYITPMEIAVATPEDPRGFGRNYQLPFLFQGYFFQHLIYHKAMIRNSVAYISKQNSYNRVLLESLFSLHFPSSKVGHQYLSGIKSFSVQLKNDRFILVSNGMASSQQNKQPSHRLSFRNKSPQHLKLGANPAESNRAQANGTRSLTDPHKNNFYPMSEMLSPHYRNLNKLKAKPSKDIVTANASTAAIVHDNFNDTTASTLTTLSPDTSFASTCAPAPSQVNLAYKDLSNLSGPVKEGEIDTIKQRKKRGSFIKINRFFSWYR